MTARLDRCERIAMGLLGESAINGEKPEEEGVWGRKHAILRFSFDVQSLSISLTQPKLRGAQVAMEEILLWKAAKIMVAKTTQQLRGRMAHFRTANAIWAILAAPVDQLMAHGDGNNDWITCPNVETWNAFRHSMSVIETCMSYKERCRALSTGSLLRLLPIAERAPLKMEAKLPY